MEFTGERMIPEQNKGQQIYVDHYDRYVLAAGYVRPGMTVLDVSSGSGYGSHLLALAGAKVTGVDIDEESIEYAQTTYKHDNCKFVVGDARALDEILTQKFAMIVSFETIEHFTQTDRFLYQVKSHLAPGGLWFASTPNTDMYGLSQSRFHPKLFSLAALRMTLDRNFKHNHYYHQHGGRYIVTISSDKPISFRDLPTGTVQEMNQPIL